MLRLNRIPLRMVVLLGATALALGACGDDDGGGTASGGGTSAAKSGGAPKQTAMAKGIVGSWKVAEAAGPGAKGNMGVTYKFDKDGKVLLGGFNKCTYTHTAPDLAIKCGTVVIKFKTELKDGDKTLVLKNTAKQILTLKRS